MRSRTGPVTEISVFATEISETGMRIFPFEHFSSGNRNEHFRQNSCAFRFRGYWVRMKRTKYRRHTDPSGRYDQSEVKRNKKRNYFKQNCPIFRFAIQTFLRGSVEKKYAKRKPTVTNRNSNENTV